MSPLRIIAYIGAAILILFGVLFVLAAFSPQSPTPIGWMITGVMLVVIGFGLIWLAGVRGKREAQAKQELIQKIELSGDINLEKLTCRNCGGALSSDNIKMVAGAPVVTCPYCGTSYQLTEEPKW
jgi:Na+/melibiose symporter-like transporter